MQILAILAHFWPDFGLIWLRYQCQKLSMKIFVLVMTGLSYIGKKIQITMIFQMKLQILTTLTQFWPVFGLLWPRYQCPKLSMNTVDPIVTGLSEIIEKILSNIDCLDENADFGHFSPFSACFWPVKAPVSVSKALNGYICPSSDWI